MCQFQSVWPRNIMKMQIAEHTKCMASLHEVRSGDTLSNTWRRRRLTKGRVSRVRSGRDIQSTSLELVVCFHLNGEFVGTDLITIHYKPMYIN